MKKAAKLMLAGVLILSLGACEATNGEGQTKQKNAADEKTVIDVLNPKVEIASQFEQLASVYEKENPGVDIRIRTIGGGADTRLQLKTQLASGTGPDIFTNGGYEEARLWKEYLEDLSDQPWIPNAYDYALKPMTMDGKIYGMPMNLEGYGFIYNKDLFAKAGIKETPKTLSELRDVSEKLSAMNITPFAIGYAETWILGIHLLNIAFAHQDNPDSFIKGLSDGTQKFAGNPHFRGLLNLLDLTVQYGNQNPLTTDYNEQVTEFATGKTAMMQQGNWVQPMLDKITPNMKVGFFPMPISDDAKSNDALAIDVSTNWVVNKKTTAKKKAEAKKFLNWMVSSEQGRKIMTEQLKFIPAFSNVEYKNPGPLAADLMKYAKEGKRISWNWFKAPDGVFDEFGPAMQAYIAKQMNGDQLLQEFQKSWNKYSDK
jgi:raffinose/stachyose/melibiose transport system substrate-binding protein